MSLNQLMEIGRRSLFANQRAINITSKNIANAGTEGYTRQRVNMTNLAIGVPGIGQIGVGVEADTVSRIQQRLVENQLWQERQRQGYYDTDSRLLTQVETVFASDTDASIGNLMGEFWEAWNNLASDPESASARTVVRDKGVLLSNAFNRTHDTLIDTQREVDRDIRADVNRVNQITAQLANLNEKYTNTGNLDLLDERDRLIGELSELIKIDVRENEAGETIISTDGLLLVSGREVEQLAVETVKENGVYQTTVSLRNVGPQPAFSGGTLGSKLKHQNETIPATINHLDSLANALVERVNNIHRSGQNLEGITGQNFFSANTTGAANIRLDNGVLNAPSLIASRAAGAEVGDNSVAMSLFDIQDELLVDGDTLGTSFTGLLTEIGSQLNEANYLNDSQALIVQQLENQRDSISGVSLEEEMTQLIQFEQAYQAASRVINTVDEMMQVVLGLV